MIRPPPGDATQSPGPRIKPPSPPATPTYEGPLPAWIGGGRVYFSEDGPVRMPPLAVGERANGITVKSVDAPFRCTLLQGEQEFEFWVIDQRTNGEEFRRHTPVHPESVINDFTHDPIEVERADELMPRD